MTLFITNTPAYRCQCGRNLGSESVYFRGLQDAIAEDLKTTAKKMKQHNWSIDYPDYLELLDRQSAGRPLETLTLVKPGLQ